MSSSIPPTLRAADLLAHAPFLKTLAMGLVLDEHRAEDLVQQTMLQALERPPQEPTGIGPWLRTVCRNLALNARRSEARRRERETAVARSEAVSPQHQLVGTWVVEAVLHLREPYRAAVLLRYYEDRQPRDIARQLGVPVTTVYGRLQKGLEQLRTFLDQRVAEDHECDGPGLRKGLRALAGWPLVATGAPTPVATAAWPAIGAAALAITAVGVWYLSSQTPAPPPNAAGSQAIATSEEAPHRGAASPPQVAAPRSTTREPQRPQASAPQHILAGRALGYSRKPAGNARVTAWGQEGILASCQTSRDGTFALGIPTQPDAAEIGLHFTTPSLRQATAKRLVLPKAPATAALELGTLVLEPAGDLTLRLESPHSLTGSHQTTVFVRADDIAPRGRSHLRVQDVLVAAHRVDAPNAQPIRLGPLPPGNYLVRAYRGDHVASQRVRVKAHDTQTIPLRLVPGEFHTLRINRPVDVPATLALANRRGTLGDGRPGWCNVHFPVAPAFDAAGNVRLGPFVPGESMVAYPNALLLDCGKPLFDDWGSRCGVGQSRFATIAVGGNGGTTMVPDAMANEWRCPPATWPVARSETSDHPLGMGVDPQAVQLQAYANVVTPMLTEQGVLPPDRRTINVRRVPRSWFGRTVLASTSTHVASITLDPQGRPTHPVRFAPKRRVAVRVLDHRGTPLRGVLVEFSETEVWTARQKTVATDEDGLAVADGLGPGPIAAFTRPDHTEKAKRYPLGTLAPGQSTLERRLPPHQRLTVRFEVDGEPQLPPDVRPLRLDRGYWAGMTEHPQRGELEMLFWGASSHETILGLNFFTAGMTPFRARVREQDDQSLLAVVRTGWVQGLEVCVLPPSDGYYHLGLEITMPGESHWRRVVDAPIEALGNHRFRLETVLPAPYRLVDRTSGAAGTPFNGQDMRTRTTQVLDLSSVRWVHGTVTGTDRLDLTRITVQTQGERDPRNIEVAPHTGAFVARVPGNTHATLTVAHQHHGIRRMDLSSTESVEVAFESGTRGLFRWPGAAPRKVLLTVFTARGAHKPEFGVWIEPAGDLSHGAVFEFGGFPVGTYDICIDAAGQRPTWMEQVALAEGVDLGWIAPDPGLSIQVKLLLPEGMAMPPLQLEAKSLEPDSRYTRKVSASEPTELSIEGLGPGEHDIVLRTARNAATVRSLRKRVTIDESAPNEVVFDLR